jgi:hypothetical protein
MADKPTQPVQALDEIKRLNMIEYGSKEQEALVAGAYGYSLTDAQMIVTEWEKDHQSWPFTEVQKARAIIAAMKVKPKPISTDPGWKRSETED